MLLCLCPSVLPVPCPLPLLAADPQVHPDAARAPGPHSSRARGAKQPGLCQVQARGTVQVSRLRAPPRAQSRAEDAPQSVLSPHGNTHAQGRIPGGHGSRVPGSSAPVCSSSPHGHSWGAALVQLGSKAGPTSQDTLFSIISVSKPVAIGAPRGGSGRRAGMCPRLQPAQVGNSRPPASLLSVPEAWGSLPLQGEAREEVLPPTGPDPLSPRVLVCSPLFGCSPTHHRPLAPNPAQRRASCHHDNSPFMLLSDNQCWMPCSEYYPRRLALPCFWPLPCFS